MTGATLIKSGISNLQIHTRMFSAPIEFQISARTSPTSQFTPRAQKTHSWHPHWLWEMKQSRVYTYTPPLRAFRLFGACNACCFLHMLCYICVRVHIHTVYASQQKPSGDMYWWFRQLDWVVVGRLLYALKARATPKYYHFSRTWSQNVSQTSLQIALRRRGVKNCGDAAISSHHISKP